LNWPGNRAWKARIKLGRCLAAPWLSNGWVLHMNGEFERISILSSVEYLCIKSSAFVACKFQPSPILVCLFHVPALPSEVGSFTALSFSLLTWCGTGFWEVCSFMDSCDSSVRR
jgi:hypothetical protein